MKKTNFILAVAGFVLFFFLGVQGVSAQGISLGAVAEAQQELGGTLQQTDLASEADAALILKEEITTELQNPEDGAVAEATQALRVHYYSTIVDNLTQGQTVREALPAAIPSLSTRSYDFDSRTAVDFEKIISDTVDLLSI